MNSNISSIQLNYSMGVDHPQTIMKLYKKLSWSAKWRREGKMCQCGVRGKFGSGRVKDEKSSRENDNVIETEMRMGSCGQAWASRNSCNSLVLKKNGSEVGVTIG